MARLISDAFLPSGAVESIHTNKSVLGNQPGYAQRIPEYIPFPFQMTDHASVARPSASQPPFFAGAGDSSTKISPCLLVPTKGHNGPVPPLVGRSTSIEDRKAVIIEDWRSYTSHLREQAMGERAHFVADRNRMDEVMAEERILWDKEREDLNNTIRLLKSEVDKLRADLKRCGGSRNGLVDSATVLPEVQNQSCMTRLQRNTASNLVLQESGRNADGSRFYAPAPRNPTRTFGDSQNRVSSIPILRDSPLPVTSKEPTQSGLEIQTPTSKKDQEGDVVGDVVDISYIRSDLEGVPIKATALSPSFEEASSITSPPPKSIVTNSTSIQLGSQDKSSLQAETEVDHESLRLKLNAASAKSHTPKYSENTTPTPHRQHAHHTSIVSEEIRQFDGNIDSDPELQGPLGLRNDPPTDALFLATLTDRLNEVQESSLQSSNQVSVDSKEQPVSSKFSIEKEGLNDNNSESEDEPQLRMKPSINFGRPFGTL